MTTRVLGCNFLNIETAYMPHSNVYESAAQRAISAGQYTMFVTLYSEQITRHTRTC